MNQQISNQKIFEIIENDLKELIKKYSDLNPTGYEDHFILAASTIMIKKAFSIVFEHLNEKEAFKMIDLIYEKNKENILSK